MKAGFTAFDTADIYGPSEEILGKLRREIAGSSGTPPRFFTKYVTGDSSLQEARRVNAKSRASLGAVPDMVQFHCKPRRPRTPGWHEELDTQWHHKMPRRPQAVNAPLADAR